MLVHLICANESIYVNPISKYVRAIFRDMQIHIWSTKLIVLNELLDCCN